MSNRRKAAINPPEVSHLCVACMRPTDTRLLLEGPAEFLDVALQKMGVPETDSRALVDRVCVNSYHCDPGNRPVVDITTDVRVCGSCIARTGYHQPTLALNRSPMILYRIPDDMRMLPEEDLALAAEVRDAWLEAGDRPIVLSKDSVVLGSYSMRAHEKARAADKNGSVPAIMLDRLYAPEDSEGKERLHQIAEVITGGYAVNMQ